MSGPLIHPPHDAPEIDAPEINAGVAARKGRGVRLPAGVVTALILIVVAGGFWFVWNQMFAAKSIDASQYETNDTPAAQARSRYFEQPTTNPAADIALRRDGTGEIRVGGAIGRFTKTKNGTDVAFTYLDVRFVSPQDRQANTARFIAMLNKAAGDSAKVTADQLRKLQELTPPYNVPLADATKAQLLELWSQYGKATDADKPAIGLKLEALLRELAINGIDPATRAYDEYAAKIRAILTPEQLTELRAARGANRVRPASRPQ